MRALAALALLAMAAPALAQEEDGKTAPVDPAAYPATVKTVRVPEGYRYVTPAGMTLYMLDPRDARGRTGTVVDYCAGACAARFTPLPADPAAPPRGLWKPMQSRRSGWVWTYRGSPAFTDRTDAKPGDTSGNGWDAIMHTIEWVPPAPALDGASAAPAPVRPFYLGGRWLLADGNDHPLFTACADPCPSQPLRAGLAARPVGPWTPVDRPDGPQWTWQGRPVFVSAAILALPSEAGAQPIEAQPK